MDFNKQYLEKYKTLLQNTELQLCYQEFIKLFRFLRIELEKEMPDYSFSGNIVENNMDFAYFQITSEELKQKGIKIQIVFVYKDFNFEVWASGYNRKIQCDYYEKLRNKSLKYILNHNPNRVDYILKNVVNKKAELHSVNIILSEIKSVALELIEYCIKLQ